MRIFQLKRIGRRGLPCFRLVVKENQGKKLIKEFGFYSPVSKQIKINNPKVILELLSFGTKFSRTVQYVFFQKNLIKNKREPL